MKPLALILLAMLPLIAGARPALDKPNVILVFLDDCGYGDFSHTGNPSIHTPTITRMVHEGLNFPQYYTASPACSASRYALLTGRNPRRSGFRTWVLSPTNARYIHPNEVTIAEGLKNRGYATAFYGKWHLGTPNTNNSFNADAFPLAHGFDTWEGTNVSNDYRSNNHLIRTNPDENDLAPGYEIMVQEVLNDPIHDELTPIYRDRAVQFIKDHKDAPFFLYIAPNMPHLPIHASDEFRDRSLRGLYGDCIEEIDGMVATIIQTLEDEGIAQNTLIHFTSDNGPWIKFENTAWDDRYKEARLLVGSALPFRDGKGSTWEGGVRVPGVWYWPGTIAPASVVRSPASTFDVLPTVFALAGEPLPTGRTLDGRDIRPFLNPTEWTGNVPDFEFIYTGSGDNKVYGARKGAWKLHTRLYSQTGNNYGFSASTSNPLLFNVEQDPHERFNRKNQEPGEVSILQSVINAFNTSVDTEQTFWGSP